MGAEKQQLRRSWLHDAQHRTDSLLLLACGVDFLRRRCSSNPLEQPFIPEPARLSPELIEARPYCGPIQPAFSIFTLSLLGAPQLQKHLDRDFLRPSGISCN